MERRRSRTWASAARRLAVAATATAVLAHAAAATWSIVVVDTRTREVAVAGATCLAGTDLQRFLPVVLVGHGGAAAQSAIDFNVKNRSKIWRGFHENMSPAEILAVIAATDNQFQQRQFGIVDLRHDPLTFTGNGAGIAKGGLAGTVGDLRYAIQGNVLAGTEVLDAAEAALLGTPGDLGEKVMAAMEAARAFGGDGRCSCSSSAPASCGSPPPSFGKSAHVAFFTLARIGDVDGECLPVPGCATGDYYAEFNIVGNVNDPDPIYVLQAQYALWRALLAGRPDQVHSQVLPAARSLPADGLSQTSVELLLADVNGAPLSSGGAQIALERVSPGPAVTQLGAISDHGDGSYSIELLGGTLTGEDVWRITATDAVGPVTLQPDVRLRVDPVVPLHLGFDELSASAPASVPLTVNLGPANAGKPYMLLASASGTRPGTSFEGTVVPLNDDALFQLTKQGYNAPPLQSTKGVLDASGRAVAFFSPSTSLVAPYVGGTLDWAAVLLAAPSTVAGTGAVGVVD